MLIRRLTGRSRLSASLAAGISTVLSASGSGEVTGVATRSSSFDGSATMDGRVSTDEDAGSSPDFGMRLRWRGFPRLEPAVPYQSFQTFEEVRSLTTCLASLARHIISRILPHECPAFHMPSGAA